MSTILEALEARPFPAKVASVLDPTHLVINRGGKDQVAIGKRFIVFGIGPEIIDPETSKSLGSVELVRGTGRVVHVQDSQATIESDKMEPARRRIIKSPTFNPWKTTFDMGQEEIIESSSVAEAFNEPRVGDFARPI